GQFTARVETAMAELLAARPTAVNLRWALERQRKALLDSGVLPAGNTGPHLLSPAAVAAAVQNSRRVADAVAEDDVSICAALGRHGADYLQQLAARHPDRPLRVLTHCNAGWLATVDHGTVTALIYEARRRGLDLQVWVDETRPRNQGAMTAWELSQNGVPNTVICDNTGGHLMQNGLVDVVIVGTDRTVRNGDTANKIGTYLKALAAHDNDVPFFIALPSPSFDASLASGVGVIPIEERDPAEVLCLRGRPLAAAAGVQAASDPGLQTIELFAPGTKAANYGFDVTPARLITGYITEHGIFDASGLADGLAAAAAATGAGHGR
ncbi:MAG: S-methyl-5-thioribose-1-phosphate isomerase, partial [Spirochaetes bacterium]|nr:S-methyl-5-thioribose-1-phosphate isomerase [Spirochaetota bacterium]